MKEKQYEGWVSVHTTTTDYEADLVRGMLDEAGLPAVVLTQRDHSFNLNLGDTAQVRVLVPPERSDEALEILAGLEQLATEEEYLEARAMLDEVRDAAAILKVAAEIDSVSQTDEAREHAEQLLQAWHEAAEVLDEAEDADEEPGLELAARIEHAGVVVAEVSPEDYWRAHAAVHGIEAEKIQQARSMLSSANEDDLRIARELVEAWEQWSAYLEEAALSADPGAPDAHDDDEQSMLDTGIDRIRLSPPDDE